MWWKRPRLLEATILSETGVEALAGPAEQAELLVTLPAELHSSRNSQIMFTHAARLHLSASVHTYGEQVLFSDNVGYYISTIFRTELCGKRASSSPMCFCNRRNLSTWCNNMNIDTVVKTPVKRPFQV